MANRKTGEARVNGNLRMSRTINQKCIWLKSTWNREESNEMMSEEECLILLIKMLHQDVEIALMPCSHWNCGHRSFSLGQG